MDSKKVSELNDPELVLVTDSVEIGVIADSYSPKIKGYGCLWVKVGSGELREIWGTVSSVPYLVANAYPLMVDGLLTEWC
jgi:hypothetical protein